MLKGLREGVVIYLFNLFNFNFISFLLKIYKSIIIIFVIIERMRNEWENP